MKLVSVQVQFIRNILDSVTKEANSTIEYF